MLLRHLSSCNTCHPVYQIHSQHIPFLNHQETSRNITINPINPSLSNNYLTSIMLFTLRHSPQLLWLMSQWSWTCVAVMDMQRAITTLGRHAQFLNLVKLLLCHFSLCLSSKALSVKNSLRQKYLWAHFLYHTNPQPKPLSSPEVLTRHFPSWNPRENIVVVHLYRRRRIMCHRL